MDITQLEPNIANETEFEIPFCYTDEYLYHGIRFQTYLEKLENIFKVRKILAGNYIDGYSPYSDNCNKGEYVSLLQILSNNSLEYEAFIEDNISLLVTPLCGALETKYVSYDEWKQRQNDNQSSNFLYSYLRGECMCKKSIPFDMVKAIGVAYQRLVFFGRKDYADKLIADIQLLMSQYEIALPIVDTSRCNFIIVGDKDLYYGKKTKPFQKVIQGQKK